MTRSATTAPLNSRSENGECKAGCNEAGTPEQPDAPQVWTHRGYLPHLNVASVLQFVTFRLADSLPRQALHQLERELASLPEAKRDSARRSAIDAWLDAGMGCCALAHPRLAAVMLESLLRFDGDRYQLLAWCIMPNHVHVLIESNASLSKTVQSWKSFTGSWALARNVELDLRIPGKSLWMRDYWDRYIRDQRHLQAVVEYIHQNPVKAGLCKRPEDWRYSSSARSADGGTDLTSSTASNHAQNL